MIHLPWKPVSRIRPTISPVAVALALALAGCAASGSAPGSPGTGPTARHQPPSGTLPAHHTKPPAGTFVSLVPACACGRHTNLDLFSALSGRRLRTLMPVSLEGYQRLATPAADSTGNLLFTLTSGARCAMTGNYMECPRWVPNSCRNSVMALTPGQTGLHPLFTVPGSEAIGQAVPDRRGSMVAFMAAPCVSLTGTTGLFVRNLANGATDAITTSSDRCDGFGPPAWNRAGTELAYPLERARGRPTRIAGGFACPSGRSYLALSATSGAAGRPRLIAPTRGCVFSAAAFDRTGIVAAEGCNRGSSKNDAGAHLGQAFLVQYNHHDQLRRRFRLKPGLEQAVIGSEPRSGSVLVTQDQPANEPYPERDWVWEFNGHRLRLVAHYRAVDAAQVLAIAW